MITRKANNYLLVWINQRQPNVNCAPLSLYFNKRFCIEVNSYVLIHFKVKRNNMMCIVKQSMKQTKLVLFPEIF